nr:hypothetical protein [Acidithiobacillus caldus]
MHRMKRKGHIQSILPVTLAALAWMPLAQAANWFCAAGRIATHSAALWRIGIHRAKPLRPVGH